MYLEIYTQTINVDGSFYFVHKHFIDGVEIETKRFEMERDETLSKTQSYIDMLNNPEHFAFFADAFNVGVALREIIAQDSKFGVRKKHTYLPEHLRMKFNTPKQWIEYLNGEKRFASVYTNNEDTYKHIRSFCPISNHYLMRVYNRLLFLQTNHYIDIRLKGDINNYD